MQFRTQVYKQQATSLKLELDPETATKQTVDVPDMYLDLRN